ncbi:DUF268 domain-containing protein, partial [Desulfovibrio sp. OttesenSCG-928-A18]|nr:DUF268 domain-containing protein [Desulfovibrio sp. OttesenSCG-928-A18]
RFSRMSLLFLGVPIGSDALMWNMHRIYGKERLPLLLSGWVPVDLYTIYIRDDIFSEPIGVYSQPLIALKKIQPETALEEHLLESVEHARELMTRKHPGTRDGKMLLQILEMLSTRSS